jgi:hypothetical protein
MRNLLEKVKVSSLAGDAIPPLHAEPTGGVRLQETSLPPFQIAAPFPNETAFRIVGRNEHLESTIESYGFLFRVAGADQSMISSDPGSSSASAARFTYFAQLSRANESTNTGVSVTNADGTLTIYFSEDGGSDLDVAETFYQGDPVATFNIRLQEVLTVDQQDSGVVIGEGTLTQIRDGVFSYDAEDYRFGRTDLEARFLYTGTSAEQIADPLSYMSSIAGHVIVTLLPAAGEVVVATPGAESPGESTPTAVTDSSGDASCEGAEAWLQDSIANAGQAEAILAGIPDSASVQSLDPDEVSSAAADLADLVDTQRDAPVPDAGVSANSRLVTALGTFSRGLVLIERAVADADDVALSQALEILQDGAELMSRARDELTQVAVSCGIES